MGGKADMKNCACNLGGAFFFVTAADVDSQRALLDDRFVSVRTIPGTQDNLVCSTVSH